MTIDELITVLQNVKFERADYGDDAGKMEVFLREDYASARELGSVVLSADRERLYLE